MKAFATITFDRSFAVEGIRVIEDEKGYWVGMPARKNKKEEIKKFATEDCFSATEIISRLKVSKRFMFDLIKEGSVNILGGPGNDSGGHYVIHKSEIPKIRKLVNAKN